MGLVKIGRHFGFEEKHSITASQHCHTFILIKFKDKNHVLIYVHYMPLPSKSS